jgi:hypothetical protein
VVVGCRRQGGKGHRHICRSIYQLASLSSAACGCWLVCLPPPGLSFNVPCFCLLPPTCLLALSLSTNPRSLAAVLLCACEVGRAGQGGGWICLTG